VGIFPGGDSPEGIADLAGNVWEWTGSLYRPYATNAVGEDRGDTEGSRVVRGGSWLDNQDYARAAYRSNDHPLDRVISIGFRVLLSSPIR
jgi:formylglycine-generating enzyme required for sulfatase activity